MTSCDAQPEDPTRTGCLSPDLCNQLIVNEHPWCPPTLEHEALTSLTSPSAPSPGPNTLVLSGTASSGPAPNSPKAFPAPSGVAILVPRTPAVTLAVRQFPCFKRSIRPHLAWSESRGRLRFRVGDVNPCAGVLYHCTGRTMGSQTLPVALPFRGSLFRRAGLRRTKDPFHRRHTNAAASQARSAFRRQIPLGPVPLLALRT
jgi:hypothetical protein